MKKIYNIVKLLLSSKLFIIYNIDKDNNILKHTSDKITEDFLLHIINDLKKDLINKVTPQKYEENLLTYDIDLYNAYKECDYQIARADYVEAELEYYKLVNDPMGGDGNMLYNLYLRLLTLKKKFDEFN